MFNPFKKPFGYEIRVKGADYVVVHHLSGDFYLAVLKGAVTPAQTYVVEITPKVLDTTHAAYILGMEPVLG